MHVRVRVCVSVCGGGMCEYECGCVCVVWLGGRSLRDYGMERGEKD